MDSQRDFETVFAGTSIETGLAKGFLHEHGGAAYLPTSILGRLLPNWLPAAGSVQSRCSGTNGDQTNTASVSSMVVLRAFLYFTSCCEKHVAPVY